MGAAARVGLKDAEEVYQDILNQGLGQPPVVLAVSFP